MRGSLGRHIEVTASADEPGEGAGPDGEAPAIRKCHPAPAFGLANAAEALGGQRARGSAPRRPRDRCSTALAPDHGL